MRSRVVLAAVVVLGTAIVGACASFESADEPAVGDAGADSPADVAPSDGAIADVVDGGGDATGKRFCESVDPDGGQIVYCRDFDDGVGADQGWNDSTFAGDGSVGLDSIERVSPPSSFRARVEANVPTCAYAQVERDLGALPARTRVSFDVRVGGAGTDPNAGASYFVIGAGECIVILSSNQTKGAAHVQRGAGAQDKFYDMVASYPRPGVWAHVEATIDRASSQLAVVVDGTPSFDKGVVDLFAECMSDAGTSSLIVWPGLHCEAPSPYAREVRLDNVLVTAF